VKLRHLPKWNEERRQGARIYDELLKPLSENVIRPHQLSSFKSVYHLYVVRTQFRDELQKHLSDAAIGTGIHYPIPVHLQAAYASMGWKRGDFPETELAADHVLSLPMFPGLTEAQQNKVIETISEFVASYAVN